MTQTSVEPRLVADALRIVIYLWVAVENFILAYIYYYGYLRLKKTPVILSLQRKFFFLGLFFSYAAMVAASDLFNAEAHLILSYLIPVFVIPVGFFATQFRERSMNAETELRKVVKIKKEVNKHG